MKGKLAVLSVCIIALGLSSIAHSEANIGLMGVGGRIGLVMPEGDIDNTIGLGFNADLGTLIPDLSLNAYVDFWTKGYDVGSYYEWSWTSIGISAIAKYQFAMEGNFKPYAGGGLGFNITTWSWDYKGPTNEYWMGGLDDSSSEFDVALHFLGGGAMALSPSMDGFAELRYTIDGADYFGIYVGFCYKLK